MDFDGFLCQHVVLYNMLPLSHACPVLCFVILAHVLLSLSEPPPCYLIIV